MGRSLPRQGMASEHHPDYLAETIQFLSAWNLRAWLLKLISKTPAGPVANIAAVPMLATGSTEKRGPCWPCALLA